MLSFVMPAVVLVALSAIVPAASAQSREPDFLFGLPRGAVGVRGGYFFASAQGDIYDFLTETLTIEPNDFDAFVLGVDFAWTLHSRLDAVFGFELTRPSIDSEYREFVEENDAPILQTTRLTTVPLTASLKLYVSPRGRQVSRFAFIPAKVRPYVGGGGGVIWYRLEQFGDFVDFEDLSIFTAELQSEGWGWEAQAFAGADFRLTPKLYLTFELRYLWMDASVSGDFVGFEPIDLGGLRTTGGIGFSF
jgi:opacity protein-like surface antigen